MTLPGLPNRGAECPPAVELERFACGEPAAVGSGHLQACQECQAYVAHVKQLSEDFVRARPPERFIAQLERTPSGGRAVKPLLLSAAGVAAVLVFLIPLTRPTVPSPVTFKGSLVSISVKRGESVSTARAGERLHEGDALRFTVTVDRAGHAVVLEKDGSGKVVVVAPFQARVPQPVSAGSTVLDDSAVLDGSKGPEMFVTVFSESPFALEPLIAALGAKRPVTCAGCTVETSVFDKE